MFVGNLAQMIRKHTPDDLEEILKVWKASSDVAHHFLEPEFVKKLTYDMREFYLPDSDTWVYEYEGQIVGFISMVKHEIGGLFISPKYHSNGIGTALVDHVKKLNPSLEVEVFEKNDMGRSFYHKYGFRLIKKYHHKDSGEVLLRLRLEYETI